jgi:VWFA-related protein
MHRRASAVFAYLVVLAVVAAAGAWWSSVSAGPAPVGQAPQDTPQQPKQPPAFSSRVVVVPIDVRVMDNKTGKAVDDLKAEDFTLIEEGVVQPIRLFQKHTLTPEAAPPPGAASRIPIRRSAFGTTPVNNRIFLIMLGRGKLQEPSRALDALLRFVREKLLPQDRVAVFAYDRATDFTTDHESIAKLIERFQRVHYDIDMDVRLQVESGLSALYGSKTLPKKIQAKIDTLFLGSGALASRRVDGVDTSATQRVEADTNKETVQLQQAEVNKVGAVLSSGFVGAPLGLASWTSLDEVANERFAGITLDDYMQYTAQSLLDLSNCYAGIEYLRHLEGEKHMVYVTEKGMYLPRVEDDVALARAANDARVAIDTFQTGGLGGQQDGTPQNNWNETFAFKALRTIAELTGGVSSIAEKGDVAVNRIDEATRTDYMLGYYPSAARMDGSYRKIEIKVRRPDSTVLYRHGYVAESAVGSFDRRGFITRDRLQAAASFSREIDDIKVKLNADLKRQPDSTYQVMISATIDPSKLVLSVQNGEHVGAIDILVICGDQRGQIVAQDYQRAALKFTEEVWQQMKKSGIPYKAHIEATAGTRQVRLIVYDYGADLVGRADARVF